MGDIQLLVKVNNESGGYENIFPQTYLEAVKDKQNGITLKDILAGFNMLFLSYNSSKSNTRLQVASMYRRTGLWITYVLLDKTVVTEWYAGEAIDDDSWGTDSNWRNGSNALVGDISISTDGYWVINGVITDTKAQGESGITPMIRVNSDNHLEVSYTNGSSYIELSDNPVFTQFRVLNNKLQQSTDLGNTWEDISEELAYKFRESGNKIQMSKDLGNTWEDISSNPVFTQFRVSNNKLQQSTDLGESWSNISEELAYQFRNSGNKLQVSKDLGVTWEDTSDNIAAWFRWQANDDNLGRIQISRDNNTWENFSPEFINRMLIKGFVANLPQSAEYGDIYMVGPYYNQEDSERVNPYYRMWVMQDTWVDAGYYNKNTYNFNYNIKKTYPSVSAMDADKSNPIGTNGLAIQIGDIVTVVNSTTPSENGIYSYEGATNGWQFQSGMNFALVQETGTDPNVAMSQAAVTKKLTELEIQKVKIDDFAESALRFQYNYLDKCTTELPLANTRFTRKFLCEGKIIRKIIIKNILTESYDNTVVRNLTFFIGTILDNRITIKKEFYVNVQGGKNEYINGIDFSIDYKTSSNDVLGYYNDTHVLFFSGNTIDEGYRSYVCSSVVSVNNSYEIDEVHYAISLGYELVDYEFEEIRKNALVNITNIDNKVIGKSDLSNITAELPTNRIVFLPESDINGYIYKINLKNNLTTYYGKDIIRQLIIPVVRKEQDTVTIIDSFVLYVQGGKNEYINGIDFTYNKILESGCTIGYYQDTHNLYYTPGSDIITYQYLGSDINEEIGTKFTIDRVQYAFSFNYELKTKNSLILESYVNSLGYKRLYSIEEDIRYNNEKIEFKHKLLIDKNDLVSPTDSETLLTLSGGTMCRTQGILMADEFLITTNFTPNTDSFEVRFGKRAPLAGTMIGIRQDTECYIDLYTFDINGIELSNFKLVDTYKLNFKFSKNIPIYLAFKKITTNSTVMEFCISQNGNQISLKNKSVEGASTNEGAGSNIGHGWGNIAYFCIAGSININDLDVYMPQKTDVQCMICGHSFIEGNSISNNKNEKFSKLLQNTLGLSECIISGQGGGIFEANYNYFDYLITKGGYKPKYVLLCDGTNDRNLSFDEIKNQIDRFVRRAKEISSIPVLFTIPPLSTGYSNSAWTEANEYIRGLGELYVDMDKCFVDENGNPKLENYLSDGVHPTIEIHKLIYYRIINDVPDLLSVY